MNKSDHARLDAYERVLYVLNDYPSLVESVSVLKTKRARLEALIEEASQFKVKKLDNVRGNTIATNRLYDELSALTTNCAKVAYVWAMDQKKTQFLPIFDIERSDFRRNSREKGLEMAQRLCLTLSDVIGEMSTYGLTPSHLQKLKQAITAFEQAQPIPRKIIGDNKVGRKELIEMVKEIGILADQIEHLVVGLFSENQAEFVNRLLASIRIYDPKSRSTKIIIHVTDTKDQSIEGVYCDLMEEMGEEQYTEADGEAEIKGIKSGKYTLLLKKDGFKEKSLSITVSTGKKTKVKVVLENE
jgi:hypothetical protein